MKIKSAEFVTSVTALDHLPVSNLPEIAFIGRSNVGKSSLINSLCNRKSLAKTSSQPGKTRVLNFYRINDKLCFVDLPGYGYAKVPNQIRSGWQRMIEGYLKNRKNLILGLAIVDARHEPTKLDLAMLEWLEFYEIPYGLILTKSDKIPRQRLQQRIAKVKKDHLQISEYCRIVIPYSSVKNEGKPDLLSLISESVNSQPNANASHT